MENNNNNKTFAAQLSLISGQLTGSAKEGILELFYPQ